MFAFVAAAVLGLSPGFDFYKFGPYQNDVPRPDRILGYSAGETHSTFRDQEKVFEAIAASARDRVKEIQYGTSNEGRPLRVFAVSSPENISNLERIRQDHLKLANGEGSSKGVVPIVWINECIHGDETASFESAMWTFYNLVASRGAALSDALKNAVVIINPVYNPDGHERYVVYYNSIATGSSDPDSYEHRAPNVMLGRENHYRFDLNRDRVAFSQRETREEFAEMLQWNPQVYIDQHGQVGSYFFPPEPMSINANVDRDRNAKWTDYFGRAIGRSFDSLGFSFFVKDEFDLYYPGYLDSSNTLSGAIGMTHETDGGRVLAQERGDGSVLRLRQGIGKHFTSALAVVQASAARRQELIDDYATFKRRACSGESAGKFQRVVLTSRDRRPLERLREHLSYAGIKSRFVKPFSQTDAHSYWNPATGVAKFDGQVLVVDMAQPQAALAKALLEPGQGFEPEFTKAQLSKKTSVPDGERYPGPESAEFYDITGWALPYAYELQAWWCESRPNVVEVRTEPAVHHSLPESTVGYALRYSDQDDILSVFDALQAGARAVVTSKPMKLGTVSYPQGTFLFLAGRNDDGYEAILKKVAAQRHVEFEPLTSSYPEDGRDGPGSSSTAALKKPSIAVVMGSGDRLSECGPAWYLLEQSFKIPFTLVREDSLDRDLDRFTCVIFPLGASINRTDRFRQWLSEGHCAVILGNGLGASGFQDLSDVKGEIQSLPGALFRAQWDVRSFLSFGYERPEMAVPMEGSRIFTRRKEGGSVLTMSEDEKPSKLLTGWEWPDTEKNLKGALLLQDVPVGSGHLVVFTQDPLARAMWPGLYRSVLNAALIGSAE